MDSYGQKPGYLHNLGTRIPQYLFTAPDASTHIFEFLSDPILQGFAGAGSSGGSVLNWTDYCGFGGSATTIPLGAGPFLGCLLYHNVTRNVRDGILPSNLTSVGFSSTNDTVDRVSSLVKTIIPTCLVAYCSSQPDCAATPMCDVGRLFTNDYQLSAQGVANCWQSLCSLNVQSVNSDIAGVGVRTLPGREICHLEVAANVELRSSSHTFYKVSLPYSASASSLLLLAPSISMTEERRPVQQRRPLRRGID